MKKLRTFSIWKAVAPIGDALQEKTIIAAPC
jgi:hypothetical protein